MASSRSSSSERTAMTMSSTLRKAHCLADGQLTPPSSPDHLRQPTVRQGPRLQFSKFLRRPKSSKSGLTATVSRPVEVRTLELPACVSEMKLPPPLLYPESPVDTDCSSMSTVSPMSAPELRRVSVSYHDLREAAALQASLKPSHAATPLLPSPVTYATEEPTEAYFRFHNPRLTSAASDYKSYEDLHILSCYYDDSKTASLQDIEQQLEDGPDAPDGFLIAEDGQYSSSDSEEMPVTPKYQVRRETVCSDESDWLASTKNHAERVRRFKARCYQVVQHPMSSKKQNKENQIMLATVLVGPGRPKLVQISRPCSKSSSNGRNPTSPPRPQTPGTAPAEVSAFSPYDTPASAADIISNSLALHTSDPSYSTVSLVPSPLTLTSRSQSLTTTGTTSTAFSATLPHLNSLADPFAPKNHVSDSPSNYNQRPSRSSSLGPSSSLPKRRSRTPLPLTSPTEATARQVHTRRLERTLNAATQAINFFPDGILRLDSPAILELRSPLVLDQTYIEILKKVFPNARELLLSALAAWIIVDIYFSKTITEAGRMPGTDLTCPSSLNSWDHLTLLTARSNDSLHRIPTKARDLLGIGRPDPYAQRLNEIALVKRAVVVSCSVGVVGQKLVEALRGTYDEDIWRSLRVLVEVIEGSPAQGGWV